MLTNPLAIKIRNFTRKLGVNRLVGRLLSGNRYEDRFGNAILQAIRPGDTIWDIGANVGIYTASFAEATGSSGRVVAFEPTAACFRDLKDKFFNNSQVILKNIAMGDNDGTLAMLVETDALAATHRVVNVDSNADNVVSVEVRSASSLITTEPELFPQIVKIDVEGHEGSVMDGFTSLLSDSRLRCIGIEVHFGLLDARGENHRPKQIESMLSQYGFLVHWTDASHLFATR